jgi:hypothetical protein
MEGSPCLVKQNVGVELANVPVRLHVSRPTFVGDVTWRPNDLSGSILPFWRSGRGYPAPPANHVRPVHLFHDSVFEVRQIEVYIGIQHIPMLKDGRQITMEV